MHPTTRLAAVHRPLIRFLGKRSWPSSTCGPGLSAAHWTDGSIAPDVQHAHPAAPEELKRSFGEFLKKFQSPARTNGGGSNSGAHVYQQYWEAPSRYWNNRVKKISEEEIDAVLVSTCHPHRFRAHGPSPERRSDTALEYTSASADNNMIHVSSILFCVREQVSLYLRFIHHSPLPPLFSCLILAVRNNPDFDFSSLEIRGVHRRNRFNGHLEFQTV